MCLPKVAGLPSFALQLSIKTFGFCLMPAGQEQSSPGGQEATHLPPPSISPSRSTRGEWHGCNSLLELGPDMTPAVAQRSGVKRGERDQLFQAQDNSGLGGGGAPEKRLKTTTESEYETSTEHTPEGGHEGLCETGNDEGELGGQDPGAGGDAAAQPGESIEECMRRISCETKELLNKWQEPFSESMAYEEFCPVRVDELLREAHALEDSLIEQKEKLKMRLKMISKTLEML